MHKIVVFIPLESKEIVKSAMFAAGAGRIGNYDSCCFELVGKGQFRPLEGSDPAIGSVSNLEYVDEARVEMVCEDGRVKDVIAAMKKAHPYEEIAYDLYPLVSEKDL